MSHELRISLAIIKGAEERVEREREARELLAADPQSIEGLYLSGQLPPRAYHATRWHSSDWECSEIKRLSDVAALGRQHWFHLTGLHTLGSKSVEQIDRLLDEAGIEWAGDDCAPKRRERKPAVSEPALPQSHAQLFMLIGRLEAEVEMLRRQTAELRGDDAPRHSAGREDLETVGNVVCLPGVSLASIRQGGDDPGPAAA